VSEIARLLKRASRWPAAWVEDPVDFVIRVSVPDPAMASLQVAFGKCYEDWGAVCANRLRPTPVAARIKTQGRYLRSAPPLGGKTKVAWLESSFQAVEPDWPSRG
jgi:hypothetical protein